MADLLSLSKVRKAKARAEKESTAAENRIRFGRTKAEKLKEAAEKTLAAKQIDSLKRDG